MTSRTRKGRSLQAYKREIYLCSRCGYCRGMVRDRDDTEFVCPIRENTVGFDCFTARGRNIIARGILEGRLDVQSISPEFVDALFACTLCGSCQDHCLSLDPNTWKDFPNNKFIDHKVDVLGIAEALRGIVIEKGNPPKIVKEILHNTLLHGNPEGRPRNDRDQFTKSLDFRIKKANERKCDHLLYVGSFASYNQRSLKIVAAIARALNAADVDFCILGNQEEDSGGDALRLGEEGLFEELANKNLALFKKYEVNSIICVSPHDYDTFSNDYPVYFEEWLGLNIKVQHYTEFLLELARKGKLKIPKGFTKRVVYHDPCYLSRINGIFDPPRELIRATGADLVEMKLSRRNTYCCGGGGGGVWYEPVDKPRLSTQRAKQACDTGAEVLVVACPVCAHMLEEGVASREDCELKVMDVAEILVQDLEAGRPKKR